MTDNEHDKRTDNETTVANIEARFKVEARAYAARSTLLQQWINNGNKLPAVYQ